MTHWDIVLIIGSLVTIGTTIMIPILKLSTTITRLGCSVDTLHSEVGQINNKVEIMTDTVAEQNKTINENRTDIQSMKKKK